jgi:ATP-binding cassette subfamily B protein
MYQNFNEIIQGNTTIFISHRLSSTKFCDRIIFIADGKIKEVGSHEELMNLNKEYNKLFTMQADYYQEGKNEENKTN